MNGLTQNEMYHDYPSSPSRRAPTYNTQSLNRQNSRGFDPFSPPGGLYGVDEASAAAYEPPRYNDRMNAAMQQNYNGFDANLSHGWNSNGFGQTNTLAAIGATGRRPPGRTAGRSQLPQAWLDQGPQFGYAAPQQGFNSLPSMAPDPSSGDDDELIPTAIVIKNIPFAVKKEQLVEIMTRMNLPLPYAFNYHFDNGVFRGLAFANFTTAEETQAVIQHMNGKDLHGRRLRVEYKKMLPQAERDRIEREKRERRGQLEEQHRPSMGSQLQPSTSMSSMVGGGSGSMQARTPSPGNARMAQAIDMNDPVTLHYYGKLLVFNTDPSRGDHLDFPPNISPEDRKIIHGLAHGLGLEHHSEGVGSQRFVRVGRPGTTPSMGMSNVDAMRRGLHRAATTDFSQARSETNYPNGREAAPYLNLRDAPPSLSTSNLRAAKSHADLRSYTPSPSHSTASYPANLGGNLNRYEYSYGQDSPATTRPTPTSTLPGTAEDFLANGLGNLALNYGQPQGSPQRSQGGGLRHMVSWDRQVNQPGPIGGHRAVSANVEDGSRPRASNSALRQPRGPMPGQGAGFQQRGPRTHRSRGSDELSSPTDVDALVE